MGTPTREKTERNKNIYEQRMLKGITLQSLGKKYNLSRERVRQIVNRYKFKLDADKTLDKN